MVTGTPSEEYDPRFLTDPSDAILLKKLKSIIQEHSTHRQSPTPRVTRVLCTEELILQTIIIPALTVGFANE